MVAKLQGRLLMAVSQEFILSADKETLDTGDTGYAHGNYNSPWGQRRKDTKLTQTRGETRSRSIVSVISILDETLISALVKWFMFNRVT